MRPIILTLRFITGVPWISLGRKLYIYIYMYLEVFFACVILMILQNHDKWYIFNVLLIDTYYLDNSCHCIVFCHRSFGSSGLKNPRVSPATLFLSRVAVAIALFLVSVFFTFFSGRKSMQSLNNFNIYLNLHTHPLRCKCDMFGFFRKTSLFHWVNNSVFFGMFARDSWIFYS